MEERKPFKILSIDGGGIKGLFSAAILEKLEEVFNTQIHEQFDLICGTSTGGIIALGASAGKRMTDIVSFYENDGPKIFDERNKQLFKWPYNFYLNARRVLWGTKYSGKALEAALIREFGSLTLAESKTLLCIPAFNITTGDRRIFKKDYNSFTEDSCRKYVDIAMATSAAPTYLPVRNIGSGQFADGGLWANNPILTGLVEFLYSFKDDSRFDGVQILSISSMEKSSGECKKRCNRSFWSWKDTLFDDYSVGQSKSALFLLDKLKDNLTFPLEYVRIANPSLSEKQAHVIDMDNASHKALEALKDIGYNVAMKEKMKSKIQEIFQTGKTIK